MTDSFPLLSAALEQPFETSMPAEDVGQMLNALGLLGASYHSFDPPVPPPAPVRVQASPQPQPVALPEPLHVIEDDPRPAAEDTAREPERMAFPSMSPFAETHTPEPAETLASRKPRAVPSPARAEKTVAFEAFQSRPAPSLSLREMFHVIGSSPGTSRRSLRQVFSQRGRNC